MEEFSNSDEDISWKNIPSSNLIQLKAKIPSEEVDSETALTKTVAMRAVNFSTGWF